MKSPDLSLPGPLPLYLGLASLTLIIVRTMFISPTYISCKMRKLAQTRRTSNGPINGPRPYSNNSLSLKCLASKVLG